MNFLQMQKNYAVEKKSLTDHRKFLFGLYLEKKSHG